MEYHVYAVWDFMSLLKALQKKLCCVDVPWIPAVDPLACRFINEIVLAEESDDDGQGSIASHFELYHRAMTRCGASTTAIDQFMQGLRSGESLEGAMASADVPLPARRFMRQTFQIIESGDVCAIASAFTFGREDLLPRVFQKIVDSLNQSSGGVLQEFQYYLLRHIGLDGDEHGPMAARLLESLCGHDEARWNVAEKTALNCLVARHELWNGIDHAVRQLSHPA
jgi:hypothetical protein